jgi:hypothetical protein
MTETVEQVIWRYYNADGDLARERTDTRTVYTRRDGKQFVHLRRTRVPILRDAAGRALAFDGQDAPATVDARERWPAL